VYNLYASMQKRETTVWGVSPLQTTEWKKILHKRERRLNKDLKVRSYDET
jgi:hypothetical protein